MRNCQVAFQRNSLYAAAKKGFKEKGAPARPPEKGRKQPSWFGPGNDLAPGIKVGGSRYFAIGRETQTVKDFERQIKSRFNESYSDAWDEAPDYGRHFPRGPSTKMSKAQERRIRGSGQR